ncbi:DUF2920 family protein [Sulfurimonas sp.]
MVEHKSFSISSCDDFELDIKRKNPLQYEVTYPCDREVRGIVFIIAGFGEDTNSEYMKNLRTYTAENFSVIVVHVLYHCFYSRPNNGAVLEFDDIDIAVLQDIIQFYNIDFSDVEHINKESVLNKLSKWNESIRISMTIIPKGNEYQNFGIMQAIDHFYVLNDLKKRFTSVLEKTTPIICFGSSHGGYIANLMAKLSPDTLDLIVDNSSYAKPPRRFIVGKEIDFTKPEFTMKTGNLLIHAFTQTYWTTLKSSSYYFSNDRYEIRNLLNKEHIKNMAEKSVKKTKYSFYHSSKDTLALFTDKQEYVEELNRYGFETKLKVFTQESEIDGKFVKTLSHGLGMSIKELIKRELPAALEKSTDFAEILPPARVIYEGVEGDYICKANTISYEYKKHK